MPEGFDATLPREGEETIEVGARGGWVRCFFGHRETYGFDPDEAEQLGLLLLRAAAHARVTEARPEPTTQANPEAMCDALMATGGPRPQRRVAYTRLYPVVRGEG